MKSCICLLLLLGVSFREKSAASASNFRQSKDNAELSESHFGSPLKNVDGKYADLFEYNFVNVSDFKYEFDAGNPDINARIERPCQIYDTFCIRHFFAEHSKCRISAQQVPEPLYRAQSNDYVPSLNLMATQVNLEYRGLRTGRVEEFYINKATNNLVITLGFDYISFNSYAYLKIYRTGREPAVSSDYGGLLLGSMAITVVIPQLNDLRLDKADISTFLNVPIYSYYVFPGLVPTDPEVLPRVVLFLTTNLSLNQQELFLSQGSFIASNFIQYNICDFGLKIV